MHLSQKATYHSEWKTHGGNIIPDNSTHNLRLSSNKQTQNQLASGNPNLPKQTYSILKGIGGEGQRNLQIPFQTSTSSQNRVSVQPQGTSIVQTTEKGFKVKWHPQKPLTIFVDEDYAKSLATQKRNGHKENSKTYVHSTNSCKGSYLSSNLQSSSELILNQINSFKNRVVQPNKGGIQTQFQSVRAIQKEKFIWDQESPEKKNPIESQEIRLGEKNRSLSSANQQLEQRECQDYSKNFDRKTKAIVTKINTPPLSDKYVFHNYFSPQQIKGEKDKFSTSQSQIIPRFSAPYSINQNDKVGCSSQELKDPPHAFSMNQEKHSDSNTNSKIPKNIFSAQPEKIIEEGKNQQETNEGSKVQTKRVQDILGRVQSQAQPQKVNVDTANRSYSQISATSGFKPLSKNEQEPARSLQVSMSLVVGKSSSEIMKKSISSLTNTSQNGERQNLCGTSSETPRQIDLYDFKPILSKQSINHHTVNNTNATTFSSSNCESPVTQNFFSPSVKQMSNQKYTNLLSKPCIPTVSLQEPPRKTSLLAMSNSHLFPLYSPTHSTTHSSHFQKQTIAPSSMVNHSTLLSNEDSLHSKKYIPDAHIQSQNQHGQLKSRAENIFPQHSQLSFDFEENNTVRTLSNKKESFQDQLDKKNKDKDIKYYPEQIRSNPDQSQVNVYIKTLLENKQYQSQEKKTLNQIQQQQQVLLPQKQTTSVDSGLKPQKETQESQLSVAEEINQNKSTPLTLPQNNNLFNSAALVTSKNNNPQLPAQTQISKVPDYNPKYISYEGALILSKNVKQEIKKEIIVPEKRKYTRLQFQFIKILGKGVFGEVFMAQDLITKGMYAMKLIDKKMVLKKRMEAQAQREMYIHCNFSNHENILQCISHFEDDDYYYILMEYAPDGTCAQLIENSFAAKLTEQHASNIVKQLLLSLTYLHSKQVIHRDIKLENILLSNGLIKLCDFGCATFSENSNEEQARRSFCGTIDYVSPEMISSQIYDKEIDIWALGVIAYELNSGKSPFTQPDEQLTYQSITNIHLDFPKHFSESLKDFLKKIFIFDPRKRATAKELLGHVWIFTHSREQNKVFSQC